MTGPANGNNSPDAVAPASGLAPAGPSSGGTPPTARDARALAQRACAAAISDLKDLYERQNLPFPSSIFVNAAGVLRGIFPPTQETPSKFTAPAGNKSAATPAGSQPTVLPPGSQPASPSVPAIQSSDFDGTPSLPPRRLRKHSRVYQTPSSRHSERSAFTGSRKVSRDLPFSRVVGDLAGDVNVNVDFAAGKFSSLADCERYYDTYLQLTAEHHPDAVRYIARLLPTGLLTENSFGYVERAPSPPSSPEREDTPVDDLARTAAAAPLGVARSASVLQNGLDFSAPTRDVTFYPELPGVDPDPDAYRKGCQLTKSLPDKLDLDDPTQARLCFTRYEVLTLQCGAHRDLHVSCLENILCQGHDRNYMEKTRLAAVTNWSNSHRNLAGNLPYEPFKAVVLQVCGGEPVRFTRRTMQALTQKGSGSFDRYLSDFETQTAYVLPSPAEKLEVFMSGLNHGLRNRVVCQPDGTEWLDWESILKACKRFADADLRSRELPSKVFTMAASAAVATASSSKRLTASEKGKQKKQKTSHPAAGPSAVAKPVPAAGGSSSRTSSARAEVIKSMSKAKGLCSNCLEKRHAGERKANGMCSRPRASPEDKLGSAFTAAWAAHKTATGKDF